MKSLKTPVIVLKRMDLGETDRLLTLLTYEQGKIRAINRGARKTLSKLAGHLEPFSLTNCQLQEGRQFYTVTSAELVEPFPSIRQDLAKTSLAYYCLEMVDVLTPDDEAQSAIFELLRESLRLLNEVERSPGLAAAFTLRLLTEIGYRPELQHCTHCRTALQPDGNVFSVRLGGVLGAECRREDETGLPVAASTIKAMRLLTDQPLDLLTRLQIDTPILKQLDQITESYLHFHSGRAMRSADFVREAGQSPRSLE